MPVCNKSDEQVHLFYYPEFFRNKVNEFSFVPVSVGNQSNGKPGFMRLISSQSNNSQGLFWFTPPPNTQEFVEIIANEQTTLNFQVNTQQLSQLYSLKTPVPNSNRGNIGEVYVCNQDLSIGDNSCGTLTPDEYILSPTYRYSYEQTIQDQNGNYVTNTSFLTLYANLI